MWKNGIFYSHDGHNSPDRAVTSCEILSWTVCFVSVLFLATYISCFFSFFLFFFWEKFLKIKKERKKGPLEKIKCRGTEIFSTLKHNRPIYIPQRLALGTRACLDDEGPVLFREPTTRSEDFFYVPTPKGEREKNTTFLGFSYTVWIDLLDWMIFSDGPRSRANDIVSGSECLALYMHLTVFFTLVYKRLSSRVVPQLDWLDDVVGWQRKGPTTNFLRRGGERTFTLTLGRCSYWTLLYGRF